MAKLNIEACKKALQGGELEQKEPLFQDGEIINFTSSIIFFDDVEFRVNGDPHRRLKLSQLTGVYLSVDNEDFGVSGIVLRNGDEYILRNLLCTEFMRLVRNRSFQVNIEKGDQYQLNERSEKFQEIRDYEKMMDYIYDRLSNEDYAAVEGLAFKGYCYTLKEVRRQNYDY